MSGVEEQLPEITRRIIQVCHPEKIILFGSHARGTATRDSDLDLLIVVSQVKHPRQERVRIRRALRGTLVPVDIFLVTPQQLERLRHLPGFIYRTALQEGKVIYERN